MGTKATILTILSAVGSAVAGGLPLAAGQYGPGARDTDINLGSPASSYGTIGKSDAAYFATERDAAK
jgi:hypothetical protein